MMRASAGALLLAVVFLCPPNAAAQTWFAELSAGRTDYDPLVVDTGSNNLSGTIRYEGLKNLWMYGTAAAPLGAQDPFWSGLGAGGRLLIPHSPSGVVFGADVDVHGFVYRDRIVQYTGTGGSLDAMPFAAFSFGPAYLNVQGGWRGQTFSYSTGRESRSVLDGGVLLSLGRAFRVETEARVVGAPEGVYPSITAGFKYTSATWHLWGRAGKWVSSDIDDVTWGAGASYRIRPQLTVWTGVRQDAPDPLYWNSSRRTWSAGLSRSFGAGAQPLRVPKTVGPGLVEIRLPASASPTTELSIAGTFSDWQLRPMQRDGAEWVIRLTLSPGIYHYAFRTAEGVWFVPPSVAGRHDDGMGGHAASIVVG
jgi:hypothetical protein